MVRQPMHERLVRLLRENIPGIRGTLLDPGRAGLVAILPRGRLLVSLHSLSALRIADLEGRLARGILRVREGPARKGESNLLLVGVPRAGQRALAAAAELMHRHAPDVGWGVFDPQGEVRLVIPSLGVDIHKRAPKAATSLSSRLPGRLFTDLNCWMLKILLLREAPEGTWGGPRARASSPLELHRIAGVSRELAYRFVRSFESEGFLRETSSGLTVTRRRALMDAWFSDQRLAVARSAPVRWVLGRPEGLQDVFTPAAGVPDFAAGGFEACRLMGALHAAARGREVHVFAPLKDALDAWSLEPCDERDAHFVLLQPRAPQSVLRGRVRIQGIPVVDVLQAALDVSVHPARGREQADYLLGHVLRWKDE